MQDPHLTTSDPTNAALQSFRQERKSANSGLVDWQYVRSARSIEQQEKLFQWNGQQTLLDWVTVMAADRKILCEFRLPTSLLEESNAQYERLFEILGKRFDATPQNISNTLDFFLCSLVPNLRSVLDYGAGFGRQAILFSKIPGIQFYATDAIESSYFSQHWLYRTLGLPLWEYFDHQSSLGECLAKEESKVIHLPTWQLGLIPDRSLDLVICVWCLSEMSETAALHAVDTCVKKLKEGGYIYIRDIPFGHGLRIDTKLIKLGFLPVFQPWKLHKDEVNAVPRIYRYLPKYLDKPNTEFCKLLFTAWSSRTFSLKQMLVRIRRMMPF